MCMYVSVRDSMCVFGPIGDTMQMASHSMGNILKESAGNSATEVRLKIR